ncbi:SDR family NAD(P)-dependent oxidoreductase [Aliihoeflea sp. 2WW]|uniref:SDR family NAD(P)-dependent oxidoreductase n=1 Tax=Aliihoeflea sp. 2WW TaxID=1381123 RepID=UPI0004669EA9|nr:SDR family NAD(P)-dependent oxidoreductase [Aliihoeflea sp. 2WW]
MNISESIAVVTGGASGIGAACCKRLIHLGAKGVAILDLNEEAGNNLARELGDRSLFCKTDVADLGSVEAAVDLAESSLGPVNTVIAAAGVAAPARLFGKSGPIPMEKFDATIRVNLYGTLHVIRTAVGSMRKGPELADGERGVIICVSSGAAYEGQVGQIGYSASKAAIVGMTYPLMRELAPEGIRVVTIAPGAFDTPIYDSVPPSVKAGLEAQMMFPKRLGHPEEFAMFVEEIIRNPVHNGRTYRFDSGVILSA